MTKDDGVVVVVPQEYIITEGDKAVEAHKLRRAGWSWRTVAEEVGYGGPGEAEVEVRRMLRNAAKAYDVDKKQEIIDLEMERLDELQTAIWPDAMRGDTKAVDSCVRIINTRLKHMVGDQEIKGDVRQTLVITRDSFLETMKEIAEGDK